MWLIRWEHVLTVFYQPATIYLCKSDVLFWCWLTEINVDLNAVKRVCCLFAIKRQWNDCDSITPKRKRRESGVIIYSEFLFVCHTPVVGAKTTALDESKGCSWKKKRNAAVLWISHSDPFPLHYSPGLGLPYVERVPISNILNWRHRKTVMGTLKSLNK